MTTYAESSDVLTGGTWVLRGLVKVWQPDPEPEPEPVVDETPALTLVPEPVKVANLIACPTCGAKVGQGCRTPGGWSTRPHADRLAPRLCPCGARPEGARRYCEPCRIEARRETWRTYARNRAS